MRKPYLIVLSAFLLSFNGIAQAPQMGPLDHHREVSREEVRNRYPTGERASVGEWLFFDSAYENYFFTTPVANYVNYLFPDSTIMTNPSAPFPVWTHALAQTYDLTSPAWTFTSNIDFSQPITIDSIFIWGWYNRINSDVDTLRIQLFTPGPTAPENLWDIYWFANASTPVNLGVDTAFFCDLNYTYTSNTIDYPVWSHDIILDANFFADSTSGGTHQPIIVPSGLTMTLNEDEFHKGVFAFSMEFIPGYTHTPFVDVIGSDQNGFRPISAEFNGTDVYPTVVAQGDVTTSSIVTQDVRYNTAGTWNGSMIPMLAYTAPFSWEYIYIVPFISQTNSLALDESVNDMNFNIYPNPATDIVNVNVNSNFESEATITIFDNSGKLVKSMFNIHLNDGLNKISLDILDIPNGSYIVRIDSGTKMMSKKLFIAR